MCGSSIDTIVKGAQMSVFSATHEQDEPWSSMCRDTGILQWESKVKSASILRFIGTIAC